MTKLHPIVAAELNTLRIELTADGTILPAEELRRYHDTFRRAFGPEVLRLLSGPALLDRMHAHGNRDSLVYWLEFKDDEEFPGRFGSIAGGSALKFGVYRRKETGTWARKGSNSVPVDISLEEAVTIAERHRDQLLAAVDVLSSFSADSAKADDARYLQLQADLARVAPSVQDSAWGHKYLALLFPAVLDSFHAGEYQRWNLVRVLQLPPKLGNDWAAGRYVCAGRFVSLAHELGMPLHDALTVLNRRHGPPRSYWRVGTTDDERTRGKFWPMMRERSVVAIGWPALGDISGMSDSRETKEALAALLRAHYPGDPRLVGRNASQVMQFVARMNEGDRVLAAAGQTVLGIGEVAGAYAYEPSTDFPHHRPVKWRSFVEWKTPEAEALRTTVNAIRDYRNQVEAERHILDDAATVQTSIALPVPASSGVRGALPRLVGTPAILQSILERKGQAVLYGPPGTGKTYWALRSVRELAAQRAFGMSFDALDEPQRSRIEHGTASEPALVRMTSFHPEYGYEDFIEGYRPKAATEGHLSFSLVPGVFRRLCADAAKSPHLDFFLVIDEINRGDVPRIFGELLTMLERDKRGQSMTLAASGESFRVPLNVYLVGTMNTADRSIALLDVALRRRFGFVELMPDYSVLKGFVVAGLPLGAWLEDLNMRVRRLGGGDARNRQVGHAFLLGAKGPITTVEQFAAIMRDDIVPLLEEYCYDDFGRLADVLGPKLIDTEQQRVRRELFDVGRASELINALQRPEIATAAAAVIEDDANDASDDDVDDETSPPFSGAT
jgi:5-methylcytosine-specific restriction protein B